MITFNMERWKYPIFGFLNVIGLGISIYIIVQAVKLYNHAECGDTTPLGRLVLGSCIATLSLGGIGMAIWKMNKLSGAYMLFWFLVFFIFIMIPFFWIVIASPTLDHPNFEKDGPSLDIFRPWLRRFLLAEKKWNKMKKCMKEKQVCSRLSLNQTLYTAEYKYINELEISLSCCRPPHACGFKHINGTENWEGSSENKIPDCSTWSNNPERKCYDCDICKAGYMVNLQWKWADTMFQVMVLFYFVIPSLFGGIL